MNSWLFVVFSLVLGATGIASPQDDASPPKPGKHHEFLKQFEGTWDVKAAFWMEPGKPPVESKAVETAKLKCEGLWLVYSDKGEFLGKPFEGHGLLGYDPQKGKFVGAWVDQTASSMDLAEGTCDEKGKVFTLVSESPGADGKSIKTKRITAFKDQDTQTLTVYQGPAGQEVIVAKLEYTRKKY
jgi:hypothetical protein